MNPSFQRLMAEATRLTRAGDLQAATAAIQAALGSGASTAADDAGRGAASRSLPFDVLDVIDVQAREIAVDPAPGFEVPAAASAGRFVDGSHTDAAGTREYKLYVPPGHHGQPLPLVVMLHGCTQDPADFAAGTRMNEAALERGFFVLYPAQSRQVNASGCWNWFKRSHQRRGRGEPALLAGMTREVMKRHPIDPRRVYVAGLSAGGAMAAILGEAYPDLFAAVGVHSGLPTGSAIDVKSAFKAMKTGGEARAAGLSPPTIVFHGDRDGTVHPVNGEQVVAASAGGVAGERVHEGGPSGRPYTRHRYRDANGRVIAEHWVVHGAGHAWSGGSALGSYTDTQGPDATEEMLRFFFAHALNGAG